MKRLKNKIKKNWKKYLKQYGIIIAVLFIGIVIGRTTTEIDTIKQIVINTISGIVINSPWFILAYIGINIISKSVKEAGVQLTSHIPKWIAEYERIKTESRIIEGALRKSRGANNG